MVGGKVKAFISAVNVCPSLILVVAGNLAKTEKISLHILHSVFIKYTIAHLTSLAISVGDSC